MPTCRLCFLLDLEQAILRTLATLTGDTYSDETLRPVLGYVRCEQDAYQRVAAQCGGSPEMLDHYAWSH